jgi:Protein of unknown function (DUF3105)
VTLRRVGGAVLALAAGIGILALAVVVFGARDKSTFHEATGPGQAFPDQGSRHLEAGAPHAGFRYNSDPPTSGPHAVVPVTRDDRRLDTDRLLTALEAGNVVFVYRDPSFRAGLRALQEEIAGPFDADLAGAGQAIVLAIDVPAPGQGVTAVAWRHLLRASSPRDPALRDFAEYWLGRGATGS